MKKFSFKTGIEKIQGVALRFPFTLFFLLGLASMFLLQINKHGIDIKPARWVFFSFGIALSLSVTLFSETLKTLVYKIGLNLLAILVLMAYCWLLPEKFEAVNFYQVISIGIVLVLSAFVVPFIKKNNDIPFWEFSKTAILQLFISSIFAQVLFAGLALAVLSLKELFKVDIQPKVYQDIAVICYALFAPIYFLTNIKPEVEQYKQEFKFDKFIKILGMYIFLPILALYTIILYVYLAQIIIKWQLPNGWVSMLVSVLGLGGFISMLILYPLRLDKKKPNKVVNLLSKYFPALLLPLLVLMSVGISRRLGDYGMTVNRLYVLILNVWLYGISIYLFLSKARHLKWIIISFSAVLLLSSVGPWSVYSITRRTMLKEIGQLLNDTKLLKDGKVIDNSEKIIVLNPKISEALSEDIKYVCTNYGIEKLQRFFKDSVKSKTSSDINEKLGISDLPIKDTNFNAWIEKKSDSVIDINSYLTLVFIPSFNSDKTDILTNDQVEISLKDLNLKVNPKAMNTSAVIIPLKPKLKEILQSHKTRSSYSAKELTISAKNYKLIITSVMGNYYSQNDSIYISNCDAQLFLK